MTPADLKSVRYVTSISPRLGATQGRRTKMVNHPNRSQHALYILRPGDVSGGAGARSFYTRGIAVYK